MTSNAQRAERLSTPAPLPARGGAHPSRTRAAARRPRAAVIAVHGMGQQNRYDTMTSLARRICDIANPDTSGPALEVVNRRMDDNRSQICCEFTVPTADGGKKDVDVIEAYWAPFTEGKIGFWETVWFLLVSGLWGVTLTVKDVVDRHGFQRWVFNEVRDYGISFATLPLLAVTFSGVIGIIAIMVAALAALAARLGAFAASSFFISSISGRVPPLIVDIDLLQAQFTWVMLFMLALGVAIAATIGLAGRLASSPLLTGLTRLLLILLVVGIAFAAGLCGFALVGVTVQAASTFLLGHGIGYDAFLGWPREQLQLLAGFVPHWLRWPPVFVIPLNLLLFWVVYFFGKQFVGDVAIYVSAHRVNRYWEAREAIRNAAHEVAKDVYRCKEGGEFRYDEIYFVAHSLGSVVAYDTINAIFRDELVLRQPIDAVERTKGLLTYGSPLDKTAFLFRAYSTGSIERLAAIAALQPLIVSKAFRKLAWINIHSLADPISASIEYYGPPKDPCVDNRIDQQSFLPLVAHVQYEGHETFREALCDLIGLPRADKVTLKRQSYDEAQAG